MGISRRCAITRLKYIELSADEIVNAVKEAKRKNVQGGRIHDLLHAVAAEKAKADELWTIDRYDFNGLGEVTPKILSDENLR
jgi:hypothetical protein